MVMYHIYFYTGISRWSVNKGYMGALVSPLVIEITSIYPLGPSQLCAEFRHLYMCAVVIPPVLSLPAHERKYKKAPERPTTNLLR